MVYTLGVAVGVAGFYRVWGSAAVACFYRGSVPEWARPGMCPDVDCFTIPNVAHRAIGATTWLRIQIDVAYRTAPAGPNSHTELTGWRVAI